MKWERSKMGGKREEGKKGVTRLAEFSPFEPAFTEGSYFKNDKTS
jgi:hypothetical protein